MWITVRESIEIARPPEVVWDFTQDYSRRAEWDRSVLSAEVVDPGPPPRVRMRFRGGLAGEFRYKLFERPRRTSLAWRSEGSRWVVGGGGSWSYEPCPNGTSWTQTNSIELREGAIARVLAPWLRRALARSTRSALARARARLEAPL